MRHPVMTASRTIRIRDFRVTTHIGVGERERAEPQRLSIDLEAVEASPAAVMGDDVEEVVDYGQIVRTLRSICADQRLRLLESLAQEIARAILSDQRLSSLTLRIAKIDRYDDVAAVGIEATYVASAFAEGADQKPE